MDAIPPLWTLESAFPVIRRFEDALAPSFHCAIAGSVATKGESQNDLDIIIYPDGHEPLAENWIELTIYKSKESMIGETECLCHTNREGIQYPDQRQIYETVDLERGRKLNLFFIKW